MNSPELKCLVVEMATCRGDKDQRQIELTLICLLEDIEVMPSLLYKSVNLSLIHENQTNKIGVDK